MSQNDLDYRAIRQAVEAGLKRQKFRGRIGFLLGSVAMFIAFMVVAWIVFPSVDTTGSFSQDGFAVGSMIMLTMGWFASLMFQAASLYFDTKAGENQIRERLVAREINREMMRLGEDGAGFQEKAKRVMRLSDDGEIVEVVEDAPEQKRSALS